MKNPLSRMFSGKSEYVPVEDKNRFYFMLQQMQSNRWRITAIVLGLFTLIIVGINAGVFIGATIGSDWKEMLLILLGAFVGNLNKVVDYWFNSEDRDKMLIQKVDEEDGISLSNTLAVDVPAAPAPVAPAPVAYSAPAEEVFESPAEEVLESPEEELA